MNRVVPSFLESHVMVSRLRWHTGASLFLLGLGLFHLPIQWASPLAWEDPTSFRKPILFGISTGLTLGSLLILMEDLRPRPWDRRIRAWLCGSLVVEVLLITLQSWRSVPSHFNRSTPVDATIELAMLACILLAVALILGLTVRSLQPDAFQELSPARVLAQRTGLILLALSCILGIVITIFGNYQAVRGESPELMGAKGILKFPHGAVLHAIQTLVLWSWLCDRFGVAFGKLSVAFLAGTHVLFLIYAMRQTWMGKSRWDADMFALGLLGCAILSALISLGIASWRRRR